MTDSRNSHRSTMVLPLWRKGKYFFAIKFSLQRKALLLSRFSQERKEEAKVSTRLTRKSYKGIIYMRTFFCLSVLLWLCISCHDGKPVASDTEHHDTIPTGADSVPQRAEDSIPEPPRAADGLFDDFIYSFMRNPRFQMARTDFPLPNIVDGTNHPIPRSSWQFDRLYSKQDVYTIIFDNAKSIKAEKDTSLHRVVVESVYLDQKRIKQYLFHKINGLWRLTGLNTHRMSKNINSDFYEFYRQFSSSPRFQSLHITDPFKFKTYDSDNFQTIEGLLDVSQWPDYRPSLPKGTITNINYGQSYGNARRRVLMLCSPSGGMGCSLTFIRSGNTWLLEQLEN